jgi:hypothetical protein
MAELDQNQSPLVRSSDGIQRRPGTRRIHEPTINAPTWHFFAFYQAGALVPQRAGVTSHSQRCQRGIRLTQYDAR